MSPRRCPERARQHLVAPMGTPAEPERAGVERGATQRGVIALRSERQSVPAGNTDQAWVQQLANFMESLVD